MGKKMCIYLELSPEAGFANDENGNNSKCYSTFKMKSGKMFDCTYEEQTAVLLPIVLKQLNLKPEWVKVVTKKEYKALTSTKEKTSCPKEYGLRDELWCNLHTCGACIELSKKDENKSVEGKNEN